MVIGKISDALFPGDGDTPPPSLTPELGAAGLMVEAAQRDGAYTEVERQAASAALMKLFHLPGPKAVALRQQAETAQAQGTSITDFAVSAATLAPDQREQLVTTLWSLTVSDGATGPLEHDVLAATGDVFEMSPERLEALRPR